jgi:hypothetical protein
MIEIIRNNNARKFDQASRMNRNKLPFTRKQSRKHYQLQFDLCMDAFENGVHFLVEAVLDSSNPKERLRADFVNLDRGEIWEVDCRNEKIGSLERKKNIWLKNGFKFVILNDGLST